MQTNFLVQLGGFIPPPTCRKLTSMPCQRKKLVVAAIRDPASRKFADFRAQETKTKPAIVQNTVCDETKSEPEMVEKTVYNDNWFARLAIRHLSGSIEAITGVKTKEKGYDGLVEAASIVARRKDGEEQQEMVEETLKKAFPAAVMNMLKTLLPQSKFSRKFFAIFTTIFFSWLVGPCEVRESDFRGKREKNVVYIPKCRFLEATNCVGMCTNLCKLPSQKFINNSLGMPTNMVPNFEDQSCEIIFGQHPLADDPALKQPCYRTSCIAKRKHGVGCSS
ncbi:beta-carotene isomerase D27, chloroplastic-like [Phalaenopsis equestris]|uniref:beta-carotene isomerase D27, chloroplastic-like n=1 Tax=Phalaenopsis equestris TaxID=78828 RepID=UPI0009E3D008|nr:beta-carotene isomerase D27, chloroplastic-like [Phalaenopsis equestris]